MKIIALCLGAFLFLALLFFVCLPFFFSTSFGKKFLIDLIAKQTGFQIEIDSLSLSWFQGQTAEGIRGSNRDLNLQFTCPKIDTDAGFWQLAMKKDLGKMQISSPVIQLNAPLPSTAFVPISPKTLRFASLATPSIQMPSFQLPVKGDLSVSQGKITFSSSGIQPVAFDQIALNMKLLSSEELSLHLDCTTKEQAIQGKISLDAALSALNSTSAQIQSQAMISQLPVRGIDQLFSLLYPDYSGLLYTALGDVVDLDGHFNTSQGNFDLNINAKSPQLIAQIATQSSNGILSLKNPATLTFMLTPSLFQKLSVLSSDFKNLKLIQPISLQASIPQFTAPLPAKAADLFEAVFQATLTAPPQISLSWNDQPLILNNLNVQAIRSSPKQPLSLNATVGLQTSTQTGSIGLEATLQPPTASGIQGSLAISANQFPVDLLMLLYPSSLSSVLGEVADFKSSITLSAGGPQFFLSWQSPFLNLPALNLSLNKVWTLSSPAPFTIGLNSEMFSDIQADPIYVTLQNMILSPEHLENIQLDAKIETGKIMMNDPLPIVIQQMQTLLTIRSFNQISLDIQGNPLQGTLSGAWRPATQEFVLNKPMTLSYTLDDKLLKQRFPQAAKLLAPAPLLLSIDPMPLPLSELSLSELTIKGQLSTPKLVWGSQQEQITLQNFRLPFQWDGKGKTAVIQISSQVPSNPQGQIQGGFNVTGFSLDNGIDFTSSQIQGSLEMQNISSAFMETFFDLNGFGALAGPSFNSKIQLQSRLNQQNIQINWTSSLLNGALTFNIQNNLLQFQGTNNQLSWTLTPAGYKALDTLINSSAKVASPFEIKEATTFTFNFSSLSLPVQSIAKPTSLLDRLPTLSMNLEDLKLQGKGSNPKLTFFDKSSQEMIQFSAMNFSIDKGNAQSPIAFSLNSNVLTQVTAAGSKTGSLQFSGSINPSSNAQGVFDPSQLTCDLQLNVQDFPSRALDILARIKGRTDFPFTTLFGSTLNAQFSTHLKQFSGPLSFQLNTPFTRASLNGNLAKGALTLKEPIYAQVKLTPEMSRLLLKEVNPLNLSYIYSENPITLEIPATGFYFPFSPTNVKGIIIPQGKIELGKVACRNEGNVNIALGLLKSKQSGDLTLWFAPLDFSIQQGIVDIGRTEILLANTFDICIWGTYDLVKNYVDMILGLTAQTLNAAFGVKNLPENYVLTIPMRGPANNVEINTSGATSKVALLLAWQQANLAGAIGGGPAGALVGGLLNKMATLPDLGAKVPPPKRPYPWETTQQPTKKKTAELKHEKKRKFKQNEKPLKQILKVIR